MSNLSYHNYPGAGQAWRDSWGYSQAVTLGNVVKLSGQGGWHHQTGHLDGDDFDLQVRQAFENVERALAAAGIEDGWASVYSLRSYHVGVDKTMTLTAALLKEKTPHAPVWTSLGVASLAVPDMKIELEVEAVKK